MAFLITTKHGEVMRVIIEDQNNHFSLTKTKICD